MKKHLQLVLFLCCLGWKFAGAQCPPPGYPPTGDLCNIAPVLCTDLNGYCATLGTNNINQTFPGCGGNVLNNDEWFGFIAGTTTIIIEIIPSNCQGLNGQVGMQGAIYEGGCNGTPVATQCTCVSTPFTMTYSNFIIGQAYYVVFDGCAGDICDFQVNVLQGSTLPVPPEPPGAIIGATQVCPGAISNYTLPNPNAATFTWTVSPPTMGSILGANPSPSVDIQWNNVGSAQICVTASNPCETNPNPTCITVVSQNIPPQDQYYDICVGDCVPCAGQLFCGPTPVTGTPVTLTNWQGCDSTIVCHVTSIPPINNNIGQQTFCAPYTYQVCGNSFSQSGILIETCDNWQGCDSTVLVDLAIFDPQANIAQPIPPLGCGAGAFVIIDGANSTFAFVPDATTEFMWTGPGIVGPNDEVLVEVNQPGQYCLTVTHSRNGVVCSDTECVTVTQNNAVPQMPQISGNQMPCQGTTVNYTVTPNGTPAPDSYTWTTPNGEPITNVNPTTIQVNWNNATGGQLCVTANNGCGSSAPACIPITVTASPNTPQVTGPATVCANNQTQTYTVSSPQTGVNYTWTVPPGASFSGSGANITVNFNGAAQGAGQVCVTAQNSCGSVQECVDVDITSPPSTPVLSGPNSVCTSGGPYNFQVSSPVTGLTYNWTASNGAVVNGSGPNVTIDFSSATNGQVCVSATNPCGTSMQACQNIQVTQAPSGTISGSGAYCAGTNPSINLTVTLTGTGPWDIGYSINGGPATTVTGINSSPYTLVATQAGTYTLTSVSTASGCTGTFSGSATVTENPEPTATLSGSGSICQGSGQQAPLTIDLTGAAPWTVTWTVNNVAQAPLVINSSPYTLNIGQAQAGTVALTGVSDDNDCDGQASGSVMVTVNTSPTVNMISTDCDPTNTTYTVSFTINGGDPTSYTVLPNDGTLNGNVFTSNPIASGDGYNFDVFDANGCDTVNVSDNSVICDCTTQVGEMDQTPISECGDGPITAPYDDTNQVFDGDDVLVFILHSGSGINIVAPIISTSSTPEVSFNSTNMSYGTTYYLSAVVGNDDGSGGIDLNDDCLSVAQGTPIVFYEIPTATLSGDPAICVGDDANLTVNFTGEGPWSITYDDGTATETINGINSNPYSLVVDPAVSTTFCLTAMSDVNCPGTVSGCSDVTVNTGVQFSNLQVECNATSTAYTVTFTITGGDPASYSVTGIPGTISNGVFTSDLLPTGSGFSGVVDDANGCDPQTVSQSVVICDCTTEAGTMDTTPVAECGDGPVTVTDASGTVLDADDILVYYLHTGASNSLGTVISTNDQPAFSFDSGAMNYGTTYYISAVAGTDDGSGSIDLSDPCLSVAPGTPVTFYEIPTAILSGSTEICPGESADLTIELTGDSPWTVTINGSQVNGIVGTPYTYTVTPTVTTDYNLTVVSDEFCTDTINELQTVTVHVPPTISNLDVDCNATGTGYTVCFDINDGDPSCYQVTPANGTLTGNQFCSNLIPSGQGYLFNVTDCHGCPAVVVEEPVVDCSCITLAGDMDPSTPLMICGNQMTMPAPFYLGNEVLDPDDALCFILHNGNNQPIVTNSTGQFTFNPATMTYGQQYFISAIAGNDNGSGCPNLGDPCLSVGVGLPVTFNPTPTAQLAGDASICTGDTAQLSVTLTGDGPWELVYQNAAGNPVTVAANSSPFVINVSPPSSNVYSLISVEDANCPGTVSGNALVSVNSPPAGLNEATSCDDTNTTYTVTFNIAGGDPTTYTVTPAGNLAGNVFTSNPIPSGTPYSFAIDDANGCGPTIVDGIIVCDCTTDAGTMNTTPISICEDLTATATVNISSTLDANDVLVYVLHTNSGNALGTILATNSTPDFDFIPGVMSYNIQYFISAVVGDDNGAGSFNPNDPCLSVAPGTPVIFRPLPTVSVTGTTAICEGETASVLFTITGSGPFNVTYTLNGVTQSVPIPIAGSIPIDFMPTETTTITLVSIEDTGVGCSNTASQSVTLTVNPSVEAGTSNGDLAFCANENQSIDLDDQLTGADSGGQWSGPLGNVPGGNLNIASLQPGTYTYTYTMTAIPPCPDDEAFVTVEIAPVPVADAGEDQQLNCDVLEVTLGGSNTTTGVIYAWTGGNVSDSTASTPSTSEPGVYTLTVSNDVGCSSTDEVEITQSITTPAPHITISDVSCFGENDGFIVIDSITDGDPPYLCSFDGAPFSPQKQFTNLSPGDHTLIIMDASGCETEVIFEVGEPQEVTVNIEGNFEDENGDPIIQLGDELVLTIITTPPYAELDTVVWSTGGLDSCTTCPNITVNPTDQIVYSVMVEENGCRADDQITIFVEKVRPVYVPNAFSPNDDGINDLFSIYGGEAVAKIRSFVVFNRWGETVYEYYNFQPNDPAIGWDGKSRGEFMNPGVFTWFAEIEFIDGSAEIYEGDVTLMR